MADTVQTLCPYMEQGQEGQPCWEKGDPYCVKHSEPRFSVCVGCAGLAVQLCQDCPAPSLAGPLCGSCEHKATGLHGPKRNPHETPLSDGEPAAGGNDQTIDQMREEMTETVVLSMRASDRARRSEREKAAKVVDDLGTSMLLGFLQGAARRDANTKESG